MTCQLTQMMPTRWHTTLRQLLLPPVLPPTPTGVAAAVVPTAKDLTETSYLVKRMNQSNGTIFYQTRGGAAAAAAAAAVAAVAAKSKKAAGELLINNIF